MADPYHHAVSSVKKWGGEAAAYQPVHDWFDQPKAHFCDPRSRAMRHHAEGIRECIGVFGAAIDNGAGRMIPTRWIAEQHVIEDLKHIPTLADWLRCMEHQPWMNRPQKLSRELAVKEEAAR